MQISSLTHRPLVVAAWILAAAFAGALMALAGARLIALSSARGEVTAYAGSLLVRAAAIAHEIDQTLDHANSLSAVPCSPDDIARLREIAFRTRFVKDVGRIVNDELACSSLLAVLAKPFPVNTTPPDLETSDGRKLWASAALRLAPDTNAMVVMAKNTNVVIDPAAFLDLERPPFQYSVGIVDAGHGRVLRSWGERLVSADR